MGKRADQVRLPTFVTQHNPLTVTRASSYQLKQAMETSGLPYLEVTMPVNITSVPVMGWVLHVPVAFALPCL